MEKDIKVFCIFVFQQPKEKESTGRRIASFFNNLTPNSNKNAKKAGFTGIVTANRSESSSSSDHSNTELPPIDSKGRLTVSNSNSRSTTPSYVDVRASSRTTDKDRITKNLKSASQDKENKPLNNASKEVIAENIGAGAGSSRNHSDRVIYPVRTKTSDQLR